MQATAMLDRAIRGSSSSQTENAEQGKQDCSSLNVSDQSSSWVMRIHP
jgi:glucuronate isomerase